MFKSLLGIKKEPHLEVYKSFGSKSFFYVIGKVSETPKVTKPTKEDSRLKNFFRIFSNYTAKPYKNEKVIIKYNSEEVETYTDKSGFFEIKLDVKANLENSEWIDVEVILESTGQISNTKVLLEEGDNNAYGIISDIDDTVLYSNATNKIKLVYLTLTKNEYTRKSIDGMKDLYKYFVLGSDGKSSNPIIYVSSSHWNLYSFLNNFMELNNIPTGPMYLRKYFGIGGLIKNIGNHDHKKIAIQKIIDTYPNLKFILIGDNGQKDIEIYNEIKNNNPDRILDTYIRDVRNLDSLDSSIFIFRNNSEALEDAKSKGYII